MAQAPNSNKLSKQLEKFSKVGKDHDYKFQACFFLNAMWSETSKDAEEMWKFVYEGFHEMDIKLGSEGCCLDEFQSARFLERFGQAMTVVERRAVLKEIDVDTDNKMSVLEYFVYKYKVDIDELMSRPQGTNEDLARAEAELKKANAEIARIEKLKSDLEAKAAGSGVKAITAKNELEQLLSADQMPLRKMLISAEAALRKAQKSENVNAMGTLWWLNREVEEAKKYKPRGNLKK